MNVEKYKAYSHTSMVHGMLIWKNFLRKIFKETRRTINRIAAAAAAPHPVRIPLYILLKFTGHNPLNRYGAAFT